ncbi:MULTISPECIES: cell division protein ZapB [Shewanella]|uniref:Cell division protein ZapB n=1 Tax=Shewanella polaris TaxID=2588449 RepID=A0A4Y5YB08_9GAMM|nr:MULTISPECIES: cell division protein ZapB [Shewanella]QDE29837.1 cell division protein ZapB [Shewanella polaris]
MSFELLSQLETKIQATLENIELLKMELDEEKQKNEALILEQQELAQKNQQLQQDLDSWSDKVNGLVGLLNNEI